MLFMYYLYTWNVQYDLYLKCILIKRTEYKYMSSILKCRFKYIYKKYIKVDI